MENPLVHFVGTRLSGYARLLRKRRLGAISFWKIRFRGVETQLSLRRDRLQDYGDVCRTPAGSCIYFSGVVAYTRSGDCAIEAGELRVENACAVQLPDQFHVRRITHERVKRQEELLLKSESLELIGRVSVISSTIRRELATLGFDEFNTGVLQEHPEVGQAEAFLTKCNATKKTYALTLTSELKLKHLLATGFESVFEILQSFRNEGVDAQHSPEFTLLEAYRTGATFEDMMCITERIVTAALGAALKRWPLAEEQNALAQELLFMPFQRVTFDELCQRHLGLPLELCTLERVVEKYPALFRPGMTTFTWVFKLINKVFATALPYPTFITELPSGISPFVRAMHGREQVSERAALVIGGLDIADIYTDEHDSTRLKRALVEQAAQTGKEPSPDFMRLIDLGLPPSAGIGMGINRLALLLRGTLPLDIKETMFFPIR